MSPFNRDAQFFWLTLFAIIMSAIGTGTSFAVGWRFLAGVLLTCNLVLLTLLISHDKNRL